MAELMMKIKKVKQINMNKVLMLCTLLLFGNVYAQPIVFSSDQWSKRWGRAMKHQPPSVKLAHANVNKLNRQGWGKRRKERTNKHRRTPDYNNRFYDHNESDVLERRYAVPESYLGSRQNTYGYEPYSRNNYYGNYPMVPPMVYPGSYSGVYPGSYPGLGMPNMGFPFSSPFLLAPGLTPGMGYPW